MSDYSDNDQFQFWLMDMDDAIDRFIRSVAPEIRQQLDHSPQSLDVLEECVLVKYKSPAATRASKEAAFLDGVARYFGEVLRKGTNSKWAISFDDPKFVFHGLPILKGGKLADIPCCPLTTVTAATDRRTGRYFSTIYRNLST